MEIKRLPKKKFIKIRRLLEKIYIYQAGHFDKLLEANKKNLEKTYKQNKKQVNKRKCAIFVAQDGSKLIGFVLGDVEQEYYKVPIGFIWQLFVEEKYRNKGIGTALLKRMLEWFKERGAQHAQIGALSSNPVIKMYKRMGFAPLHSGFRKRLK